MFFPTRSKKIWEGNPTADTSHANAPRPLTPSTSKHSPAGRPDRPRPDRLDAPKSRPLVRLRDHLPRRDRRDNARSTERRERRRDDPRLVRTGRTRQEPAYRNWKGTQGVNRHPKAPNTTHPKRTPLGDPVTSGNRRPRRLKGDGVEVVALRVGDSIRQHRGRGWDAGGDGRAGGVEVGGMDLVGEGLQRMVRSGADSCERGRNTSGTEPPVQPSRSMPCLPSPPPRMPRPSRRT